MGIFAWYCLILLLMRTFFFKTVHLRLLSTECSLESRGSKEEEKKKGYIYLLIVVISGIIENIGCWEGAYEPQCLWIWWRHQHIGNWTLDRLTNSQRSIQFSSVHFSRSVVSNSSRPHESQHARPPCPSPTPGVHSNSRPSSKCHPAISSSVLPLFFLPPIPPSIRVFFQWVNSSHEVAKVLEFQL